MTTLRKALRTTSFKLSAAFLLAFAVFAAVQIGYIAYNTRVLITGQHVETIDAEINSLSEHYREGGIRRLVTTIEARARRPGANLYLLTDGLGRVIAGNVGALPAGVLEESDFRETDYERLDPTSGEPGHAVVRVFVLPGGFHLLVGRDVAERERFHDIIKSAFRWSAAMTVLLGIAAWYFVSRRVLKRIDGVADTARQIMAGNLSGRIAVTGSGDEFDRLAESLNAMLDRIEQLLQGLTEVSDNIAHDLKTPLTRLRNRVETALRVARGDADYRDALETTIVESDELIRTFNALLMIARVEAGSAEGELVELDAGAVLRDVAELYEPAAEEAGADLTVAVVGSVPARLNRELIGQALANLIDNALKYAGGDLDDGRKPVIALAACLRDRRVLLTVSDNGPGIDAADRERVLERFVRLEKSRTRPGSGLGLSLAAAVARYHGGVLRLEDAAPGLRAVIDLPANVGEAGQ